MADDDLQPDTPLTPPSSNTPPLPSIPLHLSGFLSGDTIQVQGDSGDLQFSVQFSVHKKNVSHHNLFHHHHHDFPHSNTSPAPLNSSFSTYMTPITPAHEVQDESSHRDPPLILEENHQNNQVVETTSDECGRRRIKRESIVTRLRSGVISPVTYFPRISRNLNEKERSRRRKRDRGFRVDLLERVLRRRSLPVKPCTSYSFFVVANWGLVKSPSFSEKSKRLGQLWCQLPETEKKVFEDMASKDSERYKKQCMLLKSNDI